MIEAEYILTGALKRIVFPIPGSSSTDTVRITIYRRSDGQYWDFANAAMSATSSNAAMTYVQGEFWQNSFTPPTSDVYLVTIEDSTLDVLHHIIYTATGGAVPTPPSASGATSLTTLLDRLLRSHIDHPIGDTAARTICTDLINDALSEIYQDMEDAGYSLYTERSSTFTTVANQEYVGFGDLAAGSIIDKVIAVYQISDDIKLTQLTRQEYVRILPDVTVGRTRPYGYSIFDERIYFYPAPSTAMTIYVDFLERPGLLSGGTDTPAFPAKFDGLIYAKATKLWWQMNEPDDAQKIALYEQQYEALKSKYLVNAEKYPDRLPRAASHNIKEELQRWPWVTPAGQ